MNPIEQLPDDAGIVICGHGSRAKISATEFGSLAEGLRARYPGAKIEYGFLEYSAPNIHMALDRLREQGVRRIYAVPGMLFLATHAMNDIPSVLKTYMARHPGLEISYGNELGLHDEMIEAFQARILDAMGYSSMPETGALYDTLLVVVGRGTSVATANAEAARLTRIVTENLGFGWSETVYSGVTFPSVGRGLEMALKLGFKKVVVAPYFLFGGRLVDRIYGYVDKVAGEHPGVAFHKADYLRDQHHVINAFIDRIGECITGEGGIDLMQDFEERLARGEVEVHHHHAEYRPEGEAAGTHSHHHHDHDHGHHDHDHAHGDHHHDHGHDHDHGHSHDHGHHHAPYRHIGHPHGPRTMINENVCCCFMSQFPQEIIDAETATRPVLPGTPACRRPRD